MTNSVKPDKPRMISKLLGPIAVKLGLGDRNNRIVGSMNENLGSIYWKKLDRASFEVSLGIFLR